MKNTQVGRLAFRKEGKYWNCYYALPNTMKNALHLGSVQLQYVEDPVIKDMFMELMRSIAHRTIKEALGVSLEWGGAQTAPECERSGHD